MSEPRIVSDQSYFIIAVSASPTVEVAMRELLKQVNAAWDKGYRVQGGISVIFNGTSYVVTQGLTKACPTFVLKE